MQKILLIIVCLLLLASSAQAQMSLTGLWIDSRTANDFWEINGNDEGFRFTAYGGSPAQPRYLSRGVALALEQGQLHATMRDLPERCCNQQGRLQIKIISPNQLEVSGNYWPIGNESQAQPASFTLTREGAPTATPSLPSISFDPPTRNINPGPTTPGWQGCWFGDGWASFFIVKQQNTLLMYWYYSQEAPFFGLYQLSADEQQAEGVAVSLVQKPGNTFYNHVLSLNKEALEIVVQVRRLAAPMEDGRWVSWSNAPVTSFTMQKVNDQIAPAEQSYVLNWFKDNQPQAMLEQTLQKARQQGQLLERSYE